MMRRHALLALATAALACRSKDPRCQRCGMKIDPNSAWTTELDLPSGEKQTYDTPRCALSALTAGAPPGTTIVVHEFYDRSLRTGAEVQFVDGSDVTGPMGADLVPVRPTRVTQWAPPAPPRDDETT